MNDAPPIWEVIPLAEYARPKPPAAEAVRKGLLGLFRRREPDPSTEQPLLTDQDLAPLPVDLLEMAAPWPDWRQAVPALDRALPTFHDPPPDPPRIQPLVAAPYSGLRETVRCWAQQHQWPVIEPPAAERILQRDESWFEAITEDEGPPVIIAELEHFWFRHQRGLGFVRGLLERLHHSSRACLIAANSWAWMYLESAVRIGDGLATPMTFQAFDAGRLERWLSSVHRFEEPVAFCSADDDSPVLAPAAPKSEESGSNTDAGFGKGRNFVRRLAAHSRGIPGVAWAIWRESLAVAATGEVEDRLKEAHVDSSERLIYVRPWSRIHFRSLPAGTELPDLLLLHALLIHGGLRESVLQEVLPGLRGKGHGALRKLAAQGIVEQHQGRWQVTPLGYPATREALASEGLFVDVL